MYWGEGKKRNKKKEENNKKKKKGGVGRQNIYKLLRNLENRKQLFFFRGNSVIQREGPLETRHCPVVYVWNRAMQDPFSSTSGNARYQRMSELWRCPKSQHWGWFLPRSPVGMVRVALEKWQLALSFRPCVEKWLSMVWKVLVFLRSGLRRVCFSAGCWGEMDAEWKPEGFPRQIDTTEAVDEGITRC